MVVCISDVNPGANHNGAWMRRCIHAPLSSEKSSTAGAQDAPVYSYNCSAPPKPPELLSRKYFTCPLSTSAASWLVVRMGSLPEKPPRVITGLFVARMMASAPLELDTATRYFAVP